MERVTDVVIVGGGVIGCAIAYYLRTWGREVTVLERGEIGGQASSAAAGLLAPLGPLSGPGPFADLLLSGFALLSSLVPQLEEVSGMHLDYEQTGALRLVRNPRRVAHLQKRMEAWRPLGLQMHWLSGEEARRREPLLAPDVCAAVYAPEEAQIDATQVVKAFAQAARKAGAQLYSHVEVVGLQQHNSRITGVTLSQNARMECNYLVVTAGAWAAHCAEWLGLALPVSPLRGQMLSLHQPSPPLRHIIFGEAAYLAPKGEHIFVGATKEDTGFDTQVTEEGISWLRATAARLAPALEQSRIEKMWAGLRPKTPDTRPILGPVPNFENVALATGHNSVGIMLSAITGQTIAEYVATGHIPDLIRPFSLERFTAPHITS
ncbi:MAG: glycine oxidase ThiO [Chloroflexi bacterium]|nr:glycine oxidase ThiO [Chloroflexota bacterium]